MKLSTTSQCNYEESFSYESAAVTTISSIPLADNNTNIIYNFKNSLYDTDDIVNWFLKKEDLSYTKLQLLCYYAQAWYYAIFNKKLMDSDFKAIESGPSSEKIEEKFKDAVLQVIRLKNKKDVHINLDKNDENFLKRVWATYGEYDGDYLAELAKREKPWAKAYLNSNVNEKVKPIIVPESMVEFYKPIYEQ